MNNSKNHIVIVVCLLFLVLLLSAYSCRKPGADKIGSEAVSTDTATAEPEYDSTPEPTAETVTAQQILHDGIRRFPDPVGEPVSSLVRTAICEEIRSESDSYMAFEATLCRNSPQQRSLFIVFRENSFMISERDRGGLNMELLQFGGHLYLSLGSDGVEGREPSYKTYIFSDSVDIDAVRHKVLDRIHYLTAVSSEYINDTSYSIYRQEERFDNYLDRSTVYLCHTFCRNINDQNCLMYTQYSFNYKNDLFSVSAYKKLDGEEFDGIMNSLEERKIESLEDYHDFITDFGMNDIFLDENIFETTLPRGNKSYAEADDKLVPDDKIEHIRCIDVVSPGRLFESVYDENKIKEFTDCVNNLQLTEITFGDFEKKSNVLYLWEIAVEYWDDSEIRISLYDNKYLVKNYNHYYSISSGNTADLDSFILWLKENSLEE